MVLVLLELQQNLNFPLSLHLPFLNIYYLTDWFPIIQELVLVEMEEPRLYWGGASVLLGVPVEVNKRKSKIGKLGKLGKFGKIGMLGKEYSSETRGGSKFSGISDAPILTLFIECE
jgi:hypothetical protein